MITPDMLGKTDDPSELADLIDKLMEQGSGHVNIVSEESSDGLKVDTVKSTDVCGTKGACCQPTELEPEDDE
ncbi:MULTISPECIES: hypothetical protein [Ruminococcus]|uniref:hypothetical protein n=1 Tax=Ruminococcus TaxID=1263 RepID=UPI0025F2D5FF|nr:MULTISPECIES: hypothetical protein [Ruminococcus]MBQ6252508.1 hypothetical protein [Ruminococcus sp.]MBR3666104.1 hypothetical protein [Ruminococcus sp.]MBR6995739.1 hypothetical protein [Ruminococcus sp.]